MIEDEFSNSDFISSPAEHEYGYNSMPRAKYKS